MLLFLIVTMRKHNTFTLNHSTNTNQGKSTDMNGYFADIAVAVKKCHEVLVTGPGLTRQQFKDWYEKHDQALSKVVVDSIASDHPTDAQLVAMARQYFKKFDAMAADPSQT